MWHQNPDGSWTEVSDRGPLYSNPYQFPGGQPFEWATDQKGPEPSGFDYTYDWALLDLADRVRSGRATPQEQQDYAAQRQAAMAIPQRDPLTLLRTIPQSQGEEQPLDWSHTLHQGSPDWPGIMLTLGDKVAAGTATPEEAQFYRDTYRETVNRTLEASKPDDAGLFGIGTPFGAVMALMSLAAGGAGAFGALGGAAAGAAGAGAGAGATAAAAAPAFLGIPTSTLSSIASLSSLASGATNLVGGLSGEEWLRKIAAGLSVTGGVAGISNLLSSGINSVSDVASLASKLYSTGSKAYSMAQGSGSSAPSSGTVGSRSQSQTAGDGGAGSSGRSSSTDAQGGGFSMDTNQLGPLLAGLIGAAGTGLSLADIARYMSQLKDQFGQQEHIKALIDQAYQLAASRYETYYAQTQEEQQQKQEKYQGDLERFQTFYQQTQRDDAQRQAAYGQQLMQTSEDRAQQKQVFGEEYGKVQSSYDARVREAQEDRDRRINVFGEDRQMVLQSYNQRVQEAAQDRALDLQNLQQKQGIGARLQDPAQVAAGAQGLYQPLSALARDRINTQTEEEMARRGVAGGGQYSNLMAAKAFAPLEQQMWQNALQQYLSSQSTALSAYAPTNLTGTPQFQMTNVPDMGGTPQYIRTGTPTFTTTPQPPGVPPQATSPTVPPVGNFTGNPLYPSSYTATPYAPFGTSASTGGGAGGGAAGGAAGNIAQLVSNLTKLLGGATSGSGETATPEQAAQAIAAMKTFLGPARVAEITGGDPGGSDYNSFATFPSSGDIDLTNFDVGSWDTFEAW